MLLRSSGIKGRDFSKAGENILNIKHQYSVFIQPCEYKVFLFLIIKYKYVSLSSS